MYKEHMQNFRTQLNVVSATQPSKQEGHTHVSPLQRPQ